jgi:hypothetical protein
MLGPLLQNFFGTNYNLKKISFSFLLFPPHFRENINQQPLSPSGGKQSCSVCEDPIAIYEAKLVTTSLL